MTKNSHRFSPRLRYRGLHGLGVAQLALGDDAEAHALPARQRHEGLVALADDEGVGYARGEGLAALVDEVHDVVAAHVAVDLVDDAHAAEVVAAGD